MRVSSVLFILLLASAAMVCPVQGRTVHNFNYAPSLDVKQPLSVESPTSLRDNSLWGVEHLIRVNQLAKGRDGQQLQHSIHVCFDGNATKKKTLDNSNTSLLSRNVKSAYNVLMLPDNLCISSLFSFSI
jgi:hypothetical protein